MRNPPAKGVDRCGRFWMNRTDGFYRIADLSNAGKYPSFFSNESFTPKLFIDKVTGVEYLCNSSYSTSNGVANLAAVLAIQR
jgi:hypothetical protein